MILDEIASYAKLRVEESKKKTPLEEIKEKAFSMPKNNFPFENALKNAKNSGKVGIISEVKKASPSKGIIAEDFPYVEIAKAYENANTTCISVLTEPKWFLGSDEIFAEIRENVEKPLIRKDFTIDEYQIYEAKVLGADCVLLICALLDTKTLIEYIEICDKLEISALVETHDEEEIKSALSSNARILGVNNRNLKDFSVDINNSLNLKKHIDKDIIFVAESGIKTPSDGINLAKNGSDALLIGEALMRTDDKKAFINEIMNTVI